MIVAWRITNEFQTAVLYMPFFVLGIGVAEYRLLVYMENKTIGWLSILSILFMTGFWVSGQQTTVNVLVKFVVTISVIDIVYIISTKIEWIPSLDYYVKKCGTYSLAIYCIHFSYIDISKWHAVFPQNEMIGIVVMSGFAIATSGLCIILKRVIEEFPLADFFMFGSIRLLKNKRNETVKF